MGGVMPFHMIEVYALNLCQPFDVGYHFNHTAGYYNVVDQTISVENSYSGGTQQEASSIVTDNSK